MFKSYVYVKAFMCLSKRRVVFKKLTENENVQPKFNKPNIDIPKPAQRYVRRTRKPSVFDSSLMDRVNLVVSNRIQMDIIKDFNKLTHIGIKTTTHLSERIEPLLLRLIMLIICEKKTFDGKKIYTLIIVEVFQL
jgi:hypothetical protein